MPMQGGLLGWIVLAAAAVIGAGTIWRKTIAPVVHGIDTLVKVIGPDEHGKTLPDRMKVVEERTEQLVPNGGTSLHDRIGKLEAGQKKLERGQENARKRQGEFVASLTPMVETVALLAGPPRRTAPLPAKKGTQ